MLGWSNRQGFPRRDRGVGTDANQGDTGRKGCIWSGQERDFSRQGTSWIHSRFQKSMGMYNYFSHGHVGAAAMVALS